MALNHRSLVKSIKHNILVSYAKTPAYMLSEFIHRLPKRSYNWQFVSSRGAESEIRRNVDILRKKGILLLPNYFNRQLIEALKPVFEHCITKAELGRYSPNSLNNEEIFLENRGFLDLALDSFLLEIISRYFGRNFGLARGAATRLLPTKPIRHNSYRWHHDARGRQLHVMVLLSDLESNGQRMVYLNGSQDRYYSHYRGVVKTSFDDEKFLHNLVPEELTEVIGGAGSVAIFDSNGLHSGTRNNNGTRDSLLFCYVTKRHFKKVLYKKDFLTDLPPEKMAVLNLNPNLVVV